jgi:predicted RNase H-like nuclease (RuvC/YqgF family)
MPEVTLEQAAIALGVSVDTVRRRIRLGRLSARLDDTRRSLVTVPEVPPAADIERLKRQERAQVTALRHDNAHLAELVEELRREQAQLLAQTMALREQLAAEIEAQRELRGLLANAQGQISRLLPPIAASHAG